MDDVVLKLYSFVSDKQHHKICFRRLLVFTYSIGMPSSGNKFHASPRQHQTNASLPELLSIRLQSFCVGIWGVLRSSTQGVVDFRYRCSRKSRSPDGSSDTRSKCKQMIGNVSAKQHLTMLLKGFSRKLFHDNRFGSRACARVNGRFENCDTDLFGVVVEPLECYKFFFPAIHCHWDSNCFSVQCSMNTPTLYLVKLGNPNKFQTLLKSKSSCYFRRQHYASTETPAHTW